ncbi:MAG TPA: hypothetical protein VH500_22995 [Nitrososphaeraceae archaeon]|jgi:hypothetical protein
MYRNSSAFTLSLLFSLLAISLVSPLYLIKNASASPDNAMNSKIKIIELIKQKAKSEQQDNGIQASGHFANNQIQNGSVTWIQGGLWDLVVRNNTNMDNQISNNTAAAAPVSSPKASFSANFTMVKPDGSESHVHSINNFVSNNVIIGGGDMVITGIGNIYSDGTLKFNQVPITVHLMGRQHVLGLIIDTVKTENHYASTHEMFGTLINGTGLEKIEKTRIMPTTSQSQELQNSKSMNMPMNMNMG